MEVHDAGGANYYYVQDAEAGDFRLQFRPCSESVCLKKWFIVFVLCVSVNIFGERPSVITSLLSYIV